MARSDSLYQLPDDLPVPVDDGLARHLQGMKVPSVPLRATDGSTIDLSALEGRTVVFAYPRTGRPDQEVPPAWNAIPGARGCTPQCCSFRDCHEELRAMGARLFGLSTQDTDYQREVVERLHLPFPLLSDFDLALTHALHLPTFEFEGEILLKRLTFVSYDGWIEKIFYPVFPPDRNAEEVVTWLRSSYPVPAP